MLATVPASSQHAWVTQVGPEDTGSFRQGLVVQWGCPSGTLSPQKKNEAGTHFSAWGHVFHTGALHGSLLPPAQPSASQTLVGITKRSGVHRRHLAPITRGPYGAEPGVLL